ncbi:filamentous hemagglutinin N-terminal domain-containing protein, partial [Burkholderia sp. LS-044]|uniref:filamentous hemagglutinin N-terminal domain-containing protein n=1 Tax=Burkholderia sp. LS-044 TaxID=1459967 RepID=UPI0010A62965
MKTYLTYPFSFFRSLFCRCGEKSVPSRLLLALLSRVALVVASGHALAVGTGEVVQGAATIQGGNGSPVTTINQASDRAVINWNNFDIKARDSVTFNQPGVNSATLNQVLGPDATQIMGALKANGRVFIVNPNGVVFGQGAQVDVGGVVASSLGINSADFMAGKLNFAAGATRPGLVQVEAGASITAKSFVALLGSQVSNAGNIAAGMDPNADSRGVSLVAADSATIQIGNWNVAVDQGAMNALVANSGSVMIGESQADGSIQLNAAGRNALMGALLNTGTVSNQSRGVGSETSLVSTGSTTVGGEVTALGGKVEVRGNDIDIGGNITIGDAKTDAPVFVEIGGAQTQRVTQETSSTVTATSSVDSQINISAQKVLALSGMLWAPEGEISLASTILDTGTLLPIAFKISLSGVEAVARLPLKTAGGLVVYLGKDGNFYSENGQLLDPTTHLYDEVDGHDAGTVSEATEKTRSAGSYFDSSGEEGRLHFLDSAKTEIEVPLEIGVTGAWGEIYTDSTRNHWLGGFKLMIALDGRIYLLETDVRGALTGERFLVGALDLDALRIRLDGNWRARLPKGSVLVVKNPHSSSDEMVHGKVLDSTYLDDVLQGAEAVQYVAVAGQQSREFRSWWERDHLYSYATLRSVDSDRAEYRQMVATELAKPAYDPTRGRMTEDDKKSIAGIQAAHERILDELQKESQQKKASAALDAAIAAEPDANRKALIEEKRGRGDLQTEKAAQDWL